MTTVKTKIKCKQCNTRWSLPRDAETAFEDIVSCGRKHCRFNDAPIDFFDELLNQSAEYLNNSGYLCEIEKADTDDSPSYGFLPCLAAE